MDKQQGPTVEHREVYSTSCNKSWWKGTWRYIKLNHFAVCRKLTQYCEATILQFLKNEIMRLVSLSKKEETPEISFSVHKHKKKPCKDTERRQLPKSQEERLHQKPNLPTPWSWRFSLPNCEKINVCCVSHSVCGILLWQRELRHFVVLHVQSLSYVQFFVTPWTVVHPAPLSKGFPRQEFCSGLPFPSPGNLPYPGIEPAFPALAGGFFTTEPPGPRHFLTWFKFHDQSKSTIANTLNSLGQISICVLFFLLFRRPVESNSLQPHGLQHTRPSCPSPSPRVCQSSCSLHQWCHTAISSSDALFSFCPQSFPASGTFPMSQCLHQMIKILELQLQHQSF